jgi:hypothetical protein
VKQDAIAGARPSGRWVGVVNGVGRAATYDADETSFVLRPGIGHRRNFLEAAMCDAAIVLEGGDGTVSELVSTLCLGKPVLLVGETWRRGRPDVRGLFDGADADRRSLVEVTRRRLDAATGPMAQQVREVVVEERLVVTPACRYAELAEGAATATAWLEAVVGAPRTGALPAINYFDDVRAPYDDWLTRRPGLG